MALLVIGMLVAVLMAFIVSVPKQRKVIKVDTLSHLLDNDVARMPWDGLIIFAGDCFGVAAQSAAARRHLSSMGSPAELARWSMKLRTVGDRWRLLG